jgi:hypothetical protein
MMRQAGHVARRICVRNANRNFVEKEESFFGTLAASASSFQVPRVRALLWFLVNTGMDILEKRNACSFLSKRDSFPFSVFSEKNLLRGCG